MSRSTKPLPPDNGHRPWRGLHVLMKSDAEAERLTAELPVLARLGVNALIVELNYHFEYHSHRELRDAQHVHRGAARRLVETCRQHDIRPIPMLNCLGHQSWKATTFKLLERYPEFDEAPGEFPGNEGIYCREWCSQHPGVHSIVFALIDELVDAFDADAFHAGLDEVFLIGSEHCARCRGQDPAQLFATEVVRIHEHVVTKRRVEMLMWGDRLLDGEATGYGSWEAATNGTHLAVDHIPRDIVLCDWHYELHDDYPSVAFFQQKGFRVWPAGWNEVEPTRALIACARRNAGPGLLGHLCTTWGAVGPGQLADWPPVREAMGAWS